MRAELVLMGKRIDMAPRAHRRLLVLLIYFILTALMVFSWSLDQWRGSIIFIFFATMLVNRWFLGGHYFGGLIKLFNNRLPDPPSPLMVAFRRYRHVPKDSDYLNDERELHQRDRAHYKAYHVIFIMLVVLLLLASDVRGKAERVWEWLPLTPDELFYGLALAAIQIALTLPQAILLWTEPDMEEAPLA